MAVSTPVHLTKCSSSDFAFSLSHFFCTYCQGQDLSAALVQSLRLPTRLLQLRGKLCMRPWERMSSFPMWQPSLSFWHSSDAHIPLLPRSMLHSKLKKAPAQAGPLGLQHQQQGSRKQYCQNIHLLYIYRIIPYSITQRWKENQRSGCNSLDHKVVPLQSEILTHSDASERFETGSEKLYLIWSKLLGWHSGHSEGSL